MKERVITTICWCSFSLRNWSLLQKYFFLMLSRNINFSSQRNCSQIYKVNEPTRLSLVHAPDDTARSVTELIATALAKFIRRSGYDELLAFAKWSSGPPFDVPRAILRFTTCQVSSPSVIVCSGYSTPLSSLQRLRSAKIFPRNPFELASKVYRRGLTTATRNACIIPSNTRMKIQEWGSAASVRLCTAVIAVVIVGPRCNAFVILPDAFPTSALCLGTVPCYHLFWMLYFFYSLLGKLGFFGCERSTRMLFYFGYLNVDQVIRNEECSRFSILDMCSGIWQQLGPDDSSAVISTFGYERSGPRCSNPGTRCLVFLSTTCFTKCRRNKRNEFNPCKSSDAKKKKEKEKKQQYLHSDVYTSSSTITMGVDVFLML